MPAIRKVLGQAAPAAETWADLYMCAASAGTVVSCFSATNRSTTDTKIRMAVRKGGAALANQHYEVFDFTVPGNDRFSIVEGLTLESTDVVSVYAAAANISFGLYGQENS